MFSLVLAQYTCPKPSAIVFPMQPKNYLKIFLFLGMGERPASYECHGLEHSHNRHLTDCPKLII
jgi:hypothetical protein